MSELKNKQLNYCQILTELLKTRVQFRLTDVEPAGRPSTEPTEPRMFETFQPSALHSWMQLEIRHTFRHYLL